MVQATFSRNKVLHKKKIEILFHIKNEEKCRLYFTFRYTREKFVLVPCKILPFLGGNLTHCRRIYLNTTRK